MSINNTFSGWRARRLVQFTLCIKSRKITLQTTKILSTLSSENFTDHFLKSVRTPQEKIEVYQKIIEILSKDGFNSTKWIATDEEVKSQIPEADRSTKVVKNFEEEPQPSAMLRLNCNLDTESFIVCRKTEQETPPKITQRIVLSLVWE